MAVDVRRPRDEEELAAALALREEVFCGEQGVTFEGDRDGRDDEALHLVAVDDGVVIGTCRMLIEPGGTAKFGRLCVRASARGAGVAAQLLAAAEEEARAAGARPHRHARADGRARALRARGLHALRRALRRRGHRAPGNGEAPG